MLVNEAKHFKMFFLFLYVEKKKQSFQPISLNGNLSNMKSFFSDNSRLNQLPLPQKNIIFFETFI